MQVHREQHFWQMNCPYNSLPSFPKAATASYCFLEIIWSVNIVLKDCFFFSLFTDKLEPQEYAEMGHALPPHDRARVLLKENASFQNESLPPKLRKEKCEIASCLERILIYWSEDEGPMWKSLPFTLWLGRSTSTVNAAGISFSLTTWRANCSRIQPEGLGAINNNGAAVFHSVLKNSYGQKIRQISSNSLD